MNTRSNWAFFVGGAEWIFGVIQTCLVTFFHGSEIQMSTLISDNSLSLSSKNSFGVITPRHLSYCRDGVNVFLET